MAELRWALLLAGILFVVGLVVWEKRKRQARDAARGSTFDSAHAGGGHHGPAGSVTTAGHGHPGADPGRDAGAVREEPSFSMPDLPRRDPVRDLPIVEIDARRAGGPSVGDLPVISMGEGERFGAPRESAAEMSDGPATEATQGGESVSAPREVAAPDPVERASAWLADSVPGELPQAVVLDWPPEDQRRIVALRVVPRAGERFNGSALRQALVGEGFIHGEFDIYHKPIGDGRVLLSAASLTRPGTFDPRTIDGLLFAGVNLFAVMPGPLPPRDTVERLLLVGRTLAQRLRGEALDAKGQPLTDARVAELRREAVEGAS